MIRRNEIYRESNSAQVDGLKRYIPRERIRIQAIPYPTEMWGIIMLDGLAFYFRRSRSHGIVTASSVDHKGEEVRLNQTIRPTQWFTHAPYKPLDFIPPIFTGVIENEDKELVLIALGVKDKDIVKARNQERLNHLYKESLQRREKDYERVFQKYYRNDIFGTAIMEACEEFESTRKP